MEPEGFHWVCGGSAIVFQSGPCGSHGVPFLREPGRREHETLFRPKTGRGTQTMTDPSIQFMVLGPLSTKQQKTT